MRSGTQAAPVSKKAFWTGCVLSAMPVLTLLMSGVMKFVQPEGFEKGFNDLGWDIRMSIGLGILEITCTLIYVFPRTAVLGAILLTGYLGGAIATHVRIHEQFILQSILGVLVWSGLYLRDTRLRALIPLRT